MTAPIQFCKSADGTRLALTTYGSPNAAPLLVVTPQGTSVEHPSMVDFCQALAARRYAIIFDRRGSGASERDIKAKTLETELQDIAAVAEHLGFHDFALWGNQEAALICAAYAATFPERVSHLILWGGFASGPGLARPGAVEGFTGLVKTNWRFARRTIADMVFPSGPPEERERLIQGLKEGMSPEMAAESYEFYWRLDVTAYLPRVQAPTLVLHRRGDALVPVSAARELASMIADARLVLLDGDASVAYYNLGQYIDTIWDFLGEAPPANEEPPSSAATAVRTVLFTDLVGHTEMMSRLGDDRGRDVLREHERITRDVLKANGGTEVKTMGDGFMASFGSVTKAVECAIALQRAFADREGEPLNVRVGLNAGEPIEEDGDLFGATVILASRVAAKADGGEILVADTVRGLCSGKGFLFADRGDFVAKGIEEPVRISEVSWRNG